MAFSLYTAVILVILKGVSDAADDCSQMRYIRFDGVEIPGAGDYLDIEGSDIEWAENKRVERAEEECKELCRLQPTAKAWSLEKAPNRKCSCFKIVKSDQISYTHHSGKFCDCDLKYHDSIINAASYSLPGFCQSTSEGDKPSSGPLPHGATCNLTCDGSYEGVSGALTCRARDWTSAASRVIIDPEPECQLNPTAVLYASIGGGLMAFFLLFLVVVCCLRQKQTRGEEKKHGRVIMRSAPGGRDGRGGGVGEEGIDGGVDRRKSYKKATGHLSVDEGCPEVDLMINGHQDRIVYANVDLKDVHRQQRREMAEPTTMIGLPDVDPIYLEGNIMNGNEEKNEYIIVDDNQS